jgi:hypothetical protein
MKSNPSINRVHPPTVRWPAYLEMPGEWVKVPKRFARGISSLKLSPAEFWLLIVLQTASYGDRKPRFLWRELAAFAGKDENTVRRWARSLQKKGLLATRIASREPSTPGDRSNRRNEFDLMPLLMHLERTEPRKALLSLPR